MCVGHMHVYIYKGIISEGNYQTNACEGAVLPYMPFGNVLYKTMYRFRISLPFVAFHRVAFLTYFVFRRRSRSAVYSLLSLQAFLRVSVVGHLWALTLKETASGCVRVVMWFCNCCCCCCRCLLLFVVDVVVAVVVVGASVWVFIVL